ncbi:SDR family NAD(P)-dependent oxidoreductase [Melittangium boletus]|uniref:Short-chain dehydrogenase/reductase SDR n=1 Tax=Melittangium boletus DSM 14713 TaxID=1294270 RepID=A0A250IER2_9BACT|nr:SDR family NAD(P)-dependent oxidoreductase [Melittangium boletus]ATB29652.1 short-chain dehydrogenase/reductase SDR [Melittangium boletus DSM 14713]
MKRQDVKGQVAIVTGASSGVGWQSAVRLAEAGVRLCVTARTAQALERLRDEVLQRGGECLVVPGDVTVQEDVERVVRECLAHYGRVDVLVNNAGVQSYGLFDALPWEHITRVLDVNCLGFMRFARGVLPHFRRQGRGHVLNVQSMLSRGGAPLLSAYTASKHATLGWAKALRLELEGTGIEVSNILVPSVDTNMFAHAPTLLSRAPAPVPPTYDVDVVARSVVAAVRRPGRTRVPVFLQGRLILALDAVAPWVGQFLLGHFGARMQQRDEPVERREGNLFQPMTRSYGPHGPVPPTPRWKRYSATAGLAALAGGVVLGVAGLARAAR